MQQEKTILQLRDKLPFIGYEFLTWLFIKFINNENREQITKKLEASLFKTKISIFLGERATTCLLHHKEQKMSMTGPILEESYEIFASLKEGHLLESLAFSLVIDSIKVKFSLSATDFSINQVKIISDYENQNFSDENEDLDPIDQKREEIFLRMSALDQLEKVVDVLFETFLSVRLNASLFSQELKEMKFEIEQRLEQKLKPAHQSHDSAGLGQILA